MYKLINAFQDIELTEDELAVVTGGRSGSASIHGPHTISGGINLGQLDLHACDVCGSGTGVLATGSSGVGPFVWAFNSVNTTSGTDNIHRNNFLTVFN
jgi:hypothetical protein